MPAKKSMPKKKKSKPELIRKLREGGYLFHIYPKETEVFKGRRPLGTIVGMKELSGRHCFRLAFDSRRQPRTYRGRVQAAQALQMIDDLKRKSFILVRELPADRCLAPQFQRTVENTFKSGEALMRFLCDALRLRF